MNARTTRARWSGAPTRLDRALEQASLARSRTRANDMIVAGAVTVNERVVTKPSQRVTIGDLLVVTASRQWVSRGGAKLDHALETFQIDVRDRLVLDIGASTGGFTEVALVAGAAHVIALDVGHDQLDSNLRQHSRVTVIEGCNARVLDAESLARLSQRDERPSLIVTDLSFISLGLIMPAISRCIERGAGRAGEVVALIKPQFEVGRVKDGVVRDLGLRREAIRGVLQSATAHELWPRAIAPSPILGGSGNHEYLAHFVTEHTEGCDSATEWEKWIDRVETT